MNTVNTKFFKIYVCISLFVIVVLLVGLVGVIAYGGSKVKSESATLNNKVNSFNQSIDSINKNLQNIDSQIQKQNNLATKVLPIL